MRYRAIISGLALNVMTSGCASVYLHDAKLAKQTADAATELSAVTLLAPFDAEETYLASIGPEEERAIIEFRISYRDRELARLVDRAPSGQNAAAKDNKPAKTGKPGSGAPVSDGASNLNQWSKDRLKLLLGFEPTTDQLKVLLDVSGARAFAARGLKTLDDTIKRNQDEFKAKSPAGAAALTCEKVLKTPANDVANWRSQSSGAAPHAALVWDACSRRAVLLSRPLGLPSGIIPARDGLLADAISQVETAQKSVSPVEEEAGKSAVQKLIEEAKNIAKAGQTATFDDLKENAKKALSGLGAAARVAGWEHLEAELARILLFEVCGKDSTATAEQKTEAKCNEIPSRHPAIEVDAVLRVLAALANLQDVVALDGRNANWMLAASAIAETNAVDARIELARDKAILRHRMARAQALADETALLACTQLALNDVCHGSGGYDLALASYIESWNVGRIPEAVHANREVREIRISGVKRSRAAAERQVALITAGTQQAKLYGEGGLKPDLIAQFLTALGIISIAGSD